jgi:hypothetical protein
MHPRPLPALSIAGPIVRHIVTPSVFSVLSLLLYVLCRVVILVLYAVLRPAVLWASSPTDPCTSLRIIHLLVYPDGACAVEQLSAEARDLACRAGPGFVGGGPAVEGSPLGRWSLPTMWLFKVSHWLVCTRLVQPCYAGFAGQMHITTQLCLRSTWQVSACFLFTELRYCNTDTQR